MKYRLTYDASTEGDNSMPVVWERTLEELLTPNGTESLLDWMLRETDRRGGPLVLERIADSPQEARMRRLVEADRYETVYPEGRAQRVPRNQCRCPILTVGDFCPVHGG